VESKAEKGTGKQAGLLLVEEVNQRLMPLMAGIAATKQGLLEWVHDFGLKALDELMRDDAAQIAGPKGQHQADRTHHYWGNRLS